MIKRDSHTNKCPKCKKVLLEDYAICPYCGYDFRLGKAVISGDFGTPLHRRPLLGLVAWVRLHQGTGFYRGYNP
ncbi:MAG: hypothetical protein PHI27_04410 [Eubacteriales bacterium]|nr:hypothetical protein [Eubacteriales bacterium]MDD4513039.1 hypothetical protein [Eubacteriales bacterium]